MKLGLKDTLLYSVTPLSLCFYKSAYQHQNLLFPRFLLKEVPIAFLGNAAIEIVTEWRLSSPSQGPGAVY